MPDRKRSEVKVRAVQREADLRAMRNGCGGEMGQKKVTNKKNDYLLRKESCLFLTNKSVVNSRSEQKRAKGEIFDAAKNSEKKKKIM